MSHRHLSRHHNALFSESADRRRGITRFNGKLMINLSLGLSSDGVRSLESCLKNVNNFACTVDSPQLIPLQNVKNGSFSNSISHFLVGVSSEKKNPLDKWKQMKESPLPSRAIVRCSQHSQMLLYSLILEEVSSLRVIFHFRKRFDE